MTLVALWFAQRKNFKGSKKMRASIISELRFLSTNVQKVLEDCVEFSKKVSKDIKHSKHIFLISNGIGEIVAKEGALKIKELTYTHCQSLNMNNCNNHFVNYLKRHPNTPVIFIVLDDKFKEMNIEGMRKIAEKVQFLGVVITDLKDKTSLQFFDHFAQKRVF